MQGYILAIDQGTTSSRAILFGAHGRSIASAQAEFPQIFPASGWVEHDPEAIWESVVATCKACLAKAGISAAEIAGIGITNQRETTLVWDRASGKATYNAIVWQDRRTADLCADLTRDGHTVEVQARTGLRIDSYFSATKIAWILDNVPGARADAEAGKLAFGTVDSFLLWRLTGGRVHATDATNASRTNLLDIHTGEWSETLLQLFRVPRSGLPEVRDSAAPFGVTEPGLFGAAIPVLGMAGDQQAALVGQACFKPGMMKSTYGTGCFALLNTGDQGVISRNRLLTTIAYQLDGKRTYALEGSIFIAGAAVQWLRDGLQIIASASETGALAASASDEENVYLVPAFVGLGAPYWDSNARGALYGLTRGTGRAELARAALEAVAYQTRDLLEAMRGDWSDAQGADTQGTNAQGTNAQGGETVLRVDGGMVASDWTLQFLADLLAAPVDRPVILETTALGAAYLAGRQAGLYPDLDGFARVWALDRRFTPQMPEATRARKYAGWKDCVKRTLSA